MRKRTDGITLMPDGLTSYAVRLNGVLIGYVERQLPGQGTGWFFYQGIVDAPCRIDPNKPFGTVATMEKAIAALKEFIR